MRNALVSTITLLALRMGAMLGGAVIIETVFALPGVGSLMVQSVFSRDYNVVQATVFIFAALVLTVNLINQHAGRQSVQAHPTRLIYLLRFLR